LDWIGFTSKLLSAFCSVSCGESQRYIALTVLLELLYRYFWLRWKDQRVQVGFGAVVDRFLLMEHAKQNHPEVIHSIGLSTGWEEVGRWQVSNVEGNFLYLN